jgi:hypothetical protein
MCEGRYVTEAAYIYTVSSYAEVEGQITSSSHNNPFHRKIIEKKNSKVFITTAWSPTLLFLFLTDRILVTTGILLLPVL